MAKKPFSPREASAEKSEGKFQRWNWRTHARIGPGHWKYSGKELRKMLRQMSWRRAH